MENKLSFKSSNNKIDLECLKYILDTLDALGILTCWKEKKLDDGSICFPISDAEAYAGEAYLYFKNGEIIKINKYED